MNIKLMVMAGLGLLPITGFTQGILSNAQAPANPNDDQIWIINSQGVGNTPASIHLGIGTDNPSLSHVLNTDGDLLFEGLQPGTPNHNRVLVVDALGDVKWEPLPVVPPANPPDADWFEEGTNTAPDDIDDNIWTNHNVQINNGNLFVSGLNPPANNITGLVAGNTSYFLWDPATRSLRAGRNEGADWDNRALYSFAFGRNANATRNHAISFGFNSSAAGRASYAFGNNSSTLRANAFAMGTDAVSTGLNTYAIGRGASASSDDAYALGTRSIAASASGIAIGTEARVDAADQEGIAIGFRSNSNRFGVAIGQRTTINGGGGVAIGSRATAGQSSFSGGEMSLTTGIDAVAIGFTAEAANRGVSIGAATISTDNATALGQSSRAIGANSIAIGLNSLSTRASAIAVGEGANATAARSMAFGFNSEATIEEAIAIGHDIQNANNFSLLVGFRGEPCFIIEGDLTPDQIPHSEVGINTTNPNNALEVVRNTGPIIDPNGVSGLRLTNLNAASNVQPNTRNRLLSVNNAGDVILVDACDINCAPAALSKVADTDQEIRELKDRIAALESMLKSYGLEEEKEQGIEVNVKNTPKLEQNIPNPFHTTTSISYELSESSDVVLEVFDKNGQSIAVLVNASKMAGQHTTEWTPEDLSSGLYSYILKVNGEMVAKKALYLK